MKWSFLGSGRDRGEVVGREEFSCISPHEYKKVLNRIKYIRPMTENLHGIICHRSR